MGCVEMLEMWSNPRRLHSHRNAIICMAKYDVLIVIVFVVCCNSHYTSISHFHSVYSVWATAREYIVVLGKTQLTVSYRVLWLQLLNL